MKPFTPATVKVIFDSHLQYFVRALLLIPFESCPQRCGCEEPRVVPLEAPYNQRRCTLERQRLSSEVNFYQRCLLVISHPVNRKRRRQQSSPEGNSPTKPTCLTPTVHTRARARVHAHRQKFWTQICVLMSRVR